MKIMVTGASGFVGSYVCAELRKAGHTPIAFIRQRTGGEDPPLWKMLGVRPEIVEGDLRDSTSLITALADVNPDAVIHLGAKAYVPYSYKNPTDVFETNTKGTFNVLEAIRTVNTNIRFVFAGSSEEYGKVDYRDIPLGPDSKLAPVSPYAESKVAGEKMALLYHKLYRVPSIISRAFNHEGPGRGDMYVTSAICKQVVSGKDLVLGNINSFRDWSHVQDIARGYIALAERGIPGKVYVQGSGGMSSVLSFALYAMKYYEDDYIESIERLDNGEVFERPLNIDYLGWSEWSRSRVDDAMITHLKGGGEMYPFEANGIRVNFERSAPRFIRFSEERWRPVDVPLLLSAPNMEEVGVAPTKTLYNIIKDMLDYYEKNSAGTTGH